MAGLIYASAWLRLQHPAARVAGIMTHQPMGVHATLEPDTSPAPGIRRSAADY